MIEYFYLIKDIDKNGKVVKMAVQSLSNIRNYLFEEYLLKMDNDLMIRLLRLQLDLEKVLKISITEYNSVVSYTTFTDGINEPLIKFTKLTTGEWDEKEKD